jgi:L-ascorbate metabolism protein UlaG (beta-lactamase superfamily)
MQEIEMPTVRFLGHSACEMIAGETRLLIDPFLTGNPAAVVAAADLSPTAILLTHAHNDHIGDALSIARRAQSPVVGIFEVATWFQKQGVEAHGMSIGGAHAFPWGWVKLTQAWHGSTYIDEQGEMHALGTPAGLLVRVEDRLLYHAGDTGLFGDMALIGRHGIDVALLPIGDNFTMGPEDALEAVRLLKPKTVVPIHYNTFPIIQQDAAAWARRVESEADSRCVVLEPGASLEY